MALVSVLLVQGGVYWHLKLRALKTRAPIAAGHLLIFQKAKRISVAALGVALAGLSGLVTPQDASWGLFLTGFAWLEFINYYHT